MLADSADKLKQIIVNWLQNGSHGVAQIIVNWLQMQNDASLHIRGTVNVKLT